jgi:hypothetical protein
VEAIHTCWCCCHEDDDPEQPNTPYTNDAFTLVRNHPLIIVSQRNDCEKLVQNDYHTQLRLKKFNKFGSAMYFFFFFLYTIYLVLFTIIILRGRNPKVFYDTASVNFTYDLSTCKLVSNYYVNNTNFMDGAIKSAPDKILKCCLYAVLSTFILAKLTVIGVLYPKSLRTGGAYIEMAALIFSYVYVLDWSSWQDEVKFRCPVQYQLGAMGVLLSYANFLVYLRTTPVFGIGIFVVMFQVISVKFFRFLPVFLVIITGFGFTYWMLLQDQLVYRTPIEALMRTGLMLFDLGYESRLYGENNDTQVYYTLTYVIFILTAIALPIFVINLLIGKLDSVQ